MRALAGLFAFLLVAPAFADWQVKRSPFDKAVVEGYRRELGANPLARAPLRKLTALYRTYRSLDELEADYRRLSAQANNPAAGIVLGLILEERGKREEGLRWSEELAKRFPSDARAAFALGEAYLSRAREGEARAPLEAALAEAAPGPLRRQILEKLTTIATSSKNGLSKVEALALARRSFTELIRLSSGNMALQQKWAEALEQFEQFAEAADKWLAIAAELRKDPSRRVEALTRSGELDERANKDDAALQAYEAAMKELPRDHHLRRELGDKIVGIYRRKDDLGQLVARWEKEWSQNTRDFWQWELLGRLYDELGDIPRAEQALQKALTRNPQAVQVHQRLIALFERSGNEEAALAQHRRLVGVAPGDLRFQLSFAERLYKGGEHEQALKRAATVGKQSGDANIHRELAELYLRWSRADLALIERERLIRLEPDDETHLIGLGEVYFQKGERAKAVECWRRILRLGKPKGEALARLAQVYADHDLLNEALELYETARKTAPPSLALEREYAALLERLRREVEAEHIWVKLLATALSGQDRALQLELRQRLLGNLARSGRLGAWLSEYRRKRPSENPVERDAYGLLFAEALIKANRQSEAEIHLRALTERAQEEAKVDAWVLLGQLYRTRKQHDKAIAAFEKAIQLSPRRAPLLYPQIADLSLELYRDGDALAYAKKAVTTNPQDPSAQVRLGELLEKREQTDEALAAYDLALKADPRLWKATFAAARLHLRRGEHRQAAERYRHVIRAAKEEEVVVDAVHRAIEVEAYLGTLAELQHELEPLAFAHPDRRVYRNLLVEIYQRSARPLVEKAASGEQQAVNALRRLGERAARPLLEVFADGDAVEQRKAALLLGELGNASAAVPLLMRAIPEAGQLPVEVRVAAAFSGARLATEASIPMILALAQSREKQLRLAAFYGLGRHSDARAQRALLRGLEDGNPDVEAVACLGIGRRVQPAAIVHQLSDRAKDEARSELVRAACTKALASATAPRDQDSVRPILLHLVSEDGPLVATQAARALGSIGGRAAKTALLVTALTQPAPAGDEALAQLNSPGALTAGEPRIGPDGLDVRRWLLSASAARAQSSPTAWVELEAELTSALVHALSQREHALRVLDQLDDWPEGISLGSLTKADSSQHQREALGRMALALQPHLVKMASDPDVEVRARIVRLLVKIGGGADRVVSTLLSDPNLSVRLSGLEALAAMAILPERERLLGPALVMSLLSAAWQERLAAVHAARAVFASNRTQLASRLQQAEKDDNGFVRSAAKEALELPSHFAHPHN